MTANSFIERTACAVTSPAEQEIAPAWSAAHAPSVKDMIFGDPSRFAIESVLTQAVESTSMMAIGLFVVHVGGLRYGVYESDATTLGIASSEVERRLIDRGGRSAPFASEPDAAKIANTFREAVYAPDPEDKLFFGFSEKEFDRLRHAKHFEWDADEEFDDSSYLLQFDVGDQVRLIAYKSWAQDWYHDPTTLRDVWIEADEFYSILQQWYDAFISEWQIARTKLELQGNTMQT
ncbi:Imm42 family immunity protein [Verrucomicrobiota bacterium sgz303538]